MSVIVLVNAELTEDHHNEYLREWAVRITDPELANLIATETGFENKGLVSIIFKPNFTRF